MNACIHKASRSILPGVVSVLLWNGLGSRVWAEDGAASRLNAGDTGWVLMSSVLVLAMIVPGLALFYGGMVRSKNVLSTMMHSFIAVCLVSIVWVFWGYSLAFAPDVGGLIGDCSGWD